MAKERIQPVMKDDFVDEKSIRQERQHQEIIDLLKAIVIRLDAIKSNTCKGF